MQHQIPPIKITSKGETYFINRVTNTTNLRQSLNEDQECSAINEIEIETSQNNEKNKINNELTHQDESWRVATSNKKRKISPGTSAAGNLDTEKQ